MKLLSLLIFFLSQCKPVEKKDCSRVKNGSFEYRSNGLHYSITRENDSIQTEVNRITGDTSVTAVTWTGECSYQLRLLESTVIYPDSISERRKSSVLTVQILRLTDEYYVYQSQSDIFNRVMTDTLWIRH